MGMVDAAIATMIHQEKSDILLMGGVCGGRSGAVKLYDVVIPSTIIDIFTGKYQKQEFRPYAHTAQLNEDLIAYLQETSRKEEIQERMYSLVPASSEFRRKKDIVNGLSFHFDVMACGPFVLQEDDFLEKKALAMNGKIVAYEMESYGVARSVKFCNRKNSLALVVKSVMDYTNSDKADTVAGENVKHNAAYISTLCIRVLIPYVAEFYERHKKGM